MKSLAIVIGAAFLTPTVAWAPAAWGHGGSLDINGCHYDTKKGTYHCHQGPNKGRSFKSEADMYAGQRGTGIDRPDKMSTKEERRDDPGKTVDKGESRLDKDRNAKSDNGKTHAKDEAKTHAKDETKAHAKKSDKRRVWKKDDEKKRKTAER
jgi:hypothetical protein